MVKIYKRFDCLLLFLVVLGVYFSATGNGFVWDDISLVMENPYIQSVDGIIHFFTSDLHDVGGNTANFYRPVQIFSFSIDYFFFGISAFWFHLSSIVLHCFNVVLVYLLICNFVKRKDISFVVALLFGVHPICSEAVTYISGRADLLAVFFILTSWLWLLKYLEKSKLLAYFISIFCFLLALGSKEMAIIFPFMLGGYFAYFKQTELKKAFRILAAYFLLGVIYIVLRKTVLDFSVGYTVLKVDYLVRILTSFKLLFTYLKLYFFPVNLHMERAFSPVFEFTDKGFVLGAGVFLLFTILSRKIYRIRKNSLFGILWFGFAILPVLNIFIILNAFVSEHWLYLPLIGLNLFFVELFFCGLDKVKRIWLKNLGYGFLAVVFLGSAVGTIGANKVWKDNIALYSNIIEKGNPGFRIYNNLGNEYAKSKNYQKALECYGKSLAINAFSPITYNNLGIVYKNMGNVDKAIKCYQKAQEIDPKYKMVYNNLASLYEQKGQYDKAIEAYKKAITLSPKNSKLYSKLGALYINTGMYNSAIDVSLKAMHLDKKNVNAYNNLGVVYIKMKHYGDAVFYLEKGLTIAPKAEALQNNLQLVIRTVKYQEEQGIA